MNLRLLHLNTVDSTNTYLDRLAKEGSPHGTVVIADTQTAGRGRFRRVWFSPPGKNIYMSILIRPSGFGGESKTEVGSQRSEVGRGKIGLSDYGILPMLAGVASARAINKVLGSRMLVTLKWPNDILLKEKKLGGILVEGRIESGRELAVANTYFIVGIGINVNMTMEEMPEEIKDIATSLYIALGVEFSKDEIIDLILKEFFKLYDEFLNKGKAYIISEWQTMSSTIGRTVRAVLPDGREVCGRAVAVNDDGYLLIVKNLGGESNNRGLEVIKEGDIYHVDNH